MSVVKRANSQFWYIHFQFNNETYIQSSKTTNKKIAERMEIALKAKVHAEKYLGKKERIKFQAAWTSPALVGVSQVPFCNCSNTIGLSWFR